MTLMKHLKREAYGGCLDCGALSFYTREEFDQHLWDKHPPPHTLKFEYVGATGWDAILSWVLPEQRFARRLAWRLLRPANGKRPAGQYHGLNFRTTRLVIQMPLRTFHVLDECGTVRPCPGVPMGGF